MGLRSLIGLLVMSITLAFVGCAKDPTKVQPETRGKRGERCQARNDCAAGLACLNSICAKNEFPIEVSPLHCDKIECSEDADCCGEKATAAPARCKGRDRICNPANQYIPGCTQNAICTTDTDLVCGDGACGAGYCSNSAAIACTTATDCADACNVAGGYCTLSFTSCTIDAQCQGTCTQRRCDCLNPEYNPNAAICNDEACENICTLRCQDERCIEDNSCESDAECSAFGLPFCDGGRCVQCTEDADCNEDNKETCEKGFCHKPCEFDEECPLFNSCDKKTGDCEYVGCKTARECLLAVNGGSDPGTGGTSGQAPPPIDGLGVGDDPRLYECLPSDTEEGVNVCKIPCENDGSCGMLQVCDQGFCKFVGCKDDIDCRAYLGIANQIINEDKPYIAKAVCRE
jgi:hypothetical protein